MVPLQNECYATDTKVNEEQLRQYENLLQALPEKSSKEWDALLTYPPHERLISEASNVVDLYLHFQEDFAELVEGFYFCQSSLQFDETSDIEVFLRSLQIPKPTYSSYHTCTPYLANGEIDLIRQCVQKPNFISIVNDPTEDGIESLFSGLDLSHLERFELSWAEPRDWVLLCESLSQAESLESFQLFQCAIDTDEMSALSSVMKQTNSFVLEPFVESDIVHLSKSLTSYPQKAYIIINQSLTKESHEGLNELNQYCELTLVGSSFSVNRDRLHKDIDIISYLPG
jgi:hypothetical protein